MAFRRMLYLCALTSAVVHSGPAQALDTPTVTPVVQGFGKAVLDITAGESGAPNGFTVWWMTAADFAANGYQMQYSPTPQQGVAAFTGVPTLNTWDGQLTTFELGPHQTARVEIGDLDDESGVWFNLAGELTPGTSYVFCVSANDASGTYYPASYFSSNEEAITLFGVDCTYTQGYWKNHEDVWPVSSLLLGNVSYTQAELLDILNQPVQGNGLVSLAHQLIATKLNIANGATWDDIASTLSAADAFIGNLVIPPVGGDSVPPNQTSSMAQDLDDYNNGVTGPGHCPALSVDESSWSNVKAMYR